MNIACLNNEAKTEILVIMQYGNTGWIMNIACLNNEAKTEILVIMQYGNTGLFH